MLVERIRRGDYAVRDLPTETELANEIGTSRTTARRALLHLMDQGLLVRKPHGRLEINHADARAGGTRRIACLAPAFSSYSFNTARIAVEQAAAELNASVRLVDYVHWDDPVIPQTLTAFDGVFIVPSAETIPTPVLERFQRSPRLVFLDGDLTEWGVPSIQMLPPMFIDRIGEHLRKLGHTQIDCLNTQPHDRTITKRLERWTFWKQLNRIGGRIIDVPVKPYGDPMVQAYDELKRVLADDGLTGSALLCTTAFATTGALRALHEHGLRVPQDVSVAAVDGDGTARYQVPSRTVLEAPSLLPYVRFCIEWMMKRANGWEGPLLVEPSDVPLFVGESTGPIPSRRSRKS